MRVIPVYLQRSLFNIAVRVELIDVGPQVFDLLLVLNAGKSHFGIGDLRRRISNVILDSIRR